MTKQDILAKHVIALKDSAEMLYQESEKANDQILARADNILTEAEILCLMLNVKPAEVN